MFIRQLVTGLIVAFATTTAFAQTGAQQPPQPPAKPEEPPVYEEQVVVTASKVEQQLVNAPATVSVVTAGVIASTPGDSTYAELLQAPCPGVNITADLGARLQHHDSRRRVDAGDLARRRCSTAAASTSISSSASSRGTLLPVNTERARSRSEVVRGPGLRRLGRQRRQRRRQLHLEDAARARPATAPRFSSAR